MKLSIITVNLNNATGLEKTAESIVSQTFTDFEWIVIDGGSTDGSVDVIRKFEDRITYWVSEKDSGIYNAMNKGVKIAKGEYLQFLNSGDWLADNEVVSDFSKSDFQNPIIYGDVLLVSDKGSVQEYRYGKMSFQSMLDSSIAHQSSFISRKLLIEFPYNEKYRIVSDWEFYLKMLLKNIKFQHYDRFVSFFDTTGISGTNHELNYKERDMVIEDIIPESVLYDLESGKIGELIRLRRKHPLYAKLITISILVMKKIDRWFKA